MTVSGFEVDSSTTADATLIVSKTAPSGPRDVTFTDANDNSGTCTGCLVIDPRPTVTAVSPPAIGQGATSVPLTVTGTGFQPDGYVSINGVDIDQETWVSSTEFDLVVTVPATATTGKTSVTVDNGDGGSAVGQLKIDAKPTVKSASPAVSPGSTQTVTITGTRFVSGLTVAVSGNGLTLGSPQGVTATSVEVSVTATSTVKAGKRTITVINPDGGTGSGKVLTIS